MPDEPTQDLQLIAELAAGDDAALDALMVRWEGPLGRFASRYLHNVADTAEVVEETFVRIYLRRHDFVPGSNFAAWVFTITANLCRHRLRWRRRHPEEAFAELGAEGDAHRPLEELPARGPDPAGAAEQAERIRALREAVAQLSHEQRTAFLLHAYEGCSYREIAAVVGGSERGVETLLYRARKTLRARLAPRFAARGPDWMPVAATGPSPER